LEFQEFHNPEFSTGGFVGWEGEPAWAVGASVYCRPVKILRPPPFAQKKNMAAENCLMACMLLLIEHNARIPIQEKRTSVCLFY
jgi:hypothetical protein